MIFFSKKEVNASKLNFYRIMTNENMRTILDYNIPTSNVPFLKDSSEAATRKSKEKA